ncbi:MAG: PBP1A family penicillin-binding protein [Candidatus Rokubacteria bacterium]|nr:PBP1A family penicillin-binding protein [Candidatus Rokubacteria bacterium]
MGTWSRAAVVALVPAAVIAVAVLLATHSAVELARFERAEAQRSTYVVAAGQPLTAGVDVRAVDLATTLGRLGYVETRGMPGAPGQFRRSAGAWEIALRRGRQPIDRVRLELRGTRVTRVLRNGQPVADAALEAEVLTSVSDRPGEEYRPVRLADMPIVLLRAFLAAEDHRFFEHAGLDVRGVVRAAWANTRAGRVTQGGSTITQQLVKNRLLSPQRTFARKVREAWLATLIEWRYPKEVLLESYLNEVYLGQRSGLAVRGVGAAARAYFGKEAHQLTLGEAAVLAGMPRAPNSYSPAANPARARERRDWVLGRMRDLGWIGDADHRAALAERIVVRGGGHGQRAPYFTDHVRQELERELDEGGLGDVRGATVETTLDPALQRFADAAVSRGLERLEARHRGLRRSTPAARLQAALVAIDPRDGRVKAMVGGRDYGESQFNRATLARRQPGSAFKPFVFAAAVTARRGTPPLTAASIVTDAPITLAVKGEAWSPRNYEDRYEGRVTVRRALEASLNAATVQVAQIAGLDTVLGIARALGIESPLEPVPAIALGSFEVTPLELARAYAAFANGGGRPHGPATVRTVKLPDGTAAAFDDEPDRVLSPAEAYLMTSLLAGVVRSGTAAEARTLGANAPIAGKTGTTNDGRDAWFVGYTPTLLAAVWVGFDTREAHGLSGSAAALPIWIDFMRQALDAYPAPAFDVPAGITMTDVDATNGKRATRHCPVVVRETFLTGTEPPLCDEHGGVVDQVRDWWQRFRDWMRR